MWRSSAKMVMIILHFSTAAYTKSREDAAKRLNGQGSCEVLAPCTQSPTHKRKGQKGYLTTSNYSSPRGGIG